jgi:hypothetical protein
MGRVQESAEGSPRADAENRSIGNKIFAMIQKMMRACQGLHYGEFGVLVNAVTTNTNQTDAQTFYGRRIDEASIDRQASGISREGRTRSLKGV